MSSWFRSLLGVVVLCAGCEAAPPSGAPATGTGSSTASTASTASFGDLFGAAARVEIVQEGGGRVETSDKAKIEALLTAIGPKQVPAQTAMPKCLTPTTVHFFDAAGKKLGSFGSCAAAGLADAAKGAGRVDLPGGAMGGVQVTDVGALRTALAALSVTLP